MLDRTYCLWQECLPAHAAASWVAPNSTASRQQSTDSLAVVEISGTLAHGPSLYDMPSKVSLQSVTDEFNSLRRDETVSRVLVIFDSPGGTVSGTNAAAVALAKLAAVKPTVVYVPSVLASGALWIASAATKIVADPTAIIGSIGVYAVLQDSSRMANSIGINVEVISSGENSLKGAGTPGAPITEQHRQSMQERVDNQAALFIRAIAKNRKLKEGFVSAMADGSVFLGELAKALKLVDALGQVDDAVKLLMNLPAPMTPDDIAMNYSTSSFESIAKAYEDLKAKYGERLATVCPRIVELHKTEQSKQPFPPYKRSR